MQTVNNPSGSKGLEWDLVVPLVQLFLVHIRFRERPQTHVNPCNPAVKPTGRNMEGNRSSYVHWKLLVAYCVKQWCRLFMCSQGEAS